MLHSVRKALETKASTSNSIYFRDGIELNPRRRAPPRDQARFLALTQQNGVPNNSVDCVWAKMGITIFSKDVVSTGAWAVRWPLVM